MKSTSSHPPDEAPSSRTAAEDQLTDRGEPSTTRSPASRYTEIIEPILQPSHTVPAEKESAYTTEKEAIYNGVEKEAVYDPDGWKEVHEHEVAELPITTTQQKRKICGLSKIWCLSLTALITILIIAVAVALGVTLGRRHPLSPTVNSNFTIGGALNPEYFSATGVFNGSGIALASVNFGIDSSIFVYFQHYSGEIRSAIQEANGAWTDSNVLVARNARNGTPIASVAYLNEENANWHLFYVDVDGYVRQRVVSNNTAYEANTWTDGPLNDLNLKTNDADQIGLQACFWGESRGDIDYTNGNFSSSSNNTFISTGIHVWYANTNTSFQQYSYIFGQNQWQFDTSFPNQNGQAGVGCQTWESGTVYYISLVDLDNNINVWWKDSNNTKASTPNHPINQWTKSNIMIPDVHPSTSMGYTNYLAYQGSDGFIRGANISWDAENSTIAPSHEGGGGGLDVWKSPTPGVPGTHLSITALADQSGGSHLSLIFQVNGSDMTEWQRDDTGAWTSTEMPVNS